MLNQLTKGFGRAVRAAAVTAVVAGGIASASAQEITGAGATFPAPIYTKWGEQYKATGGPALNYQGVGSGAGVTQIINRTVDFGASDTPVAPERLASNNLLQFPAVIGAVNAVMLQAQEEGAVVVGDAVGEIDAEAVDARGEEVAGHVGERGDLGDLVGGDAELGQGGAEVLDHGVDVAVVEADQVGVAAAHVLAGVAVGAAEDHRQEALLLGGLALHVDAVEVVRDAIVRKHLAIENVDRGIEGRGAAQFVVQAHV